MGYDRNHAILVSSFDDKLVDLAHEQAMKLCPGRVSGFVSSDMNDVYSFFVAPDGSKEGWERSDEGDRERTALIEWLDTQRYSDGSTALSWAEVQYGDDHGESIVTRHSDEPWRRVKAQVLQADA